MSRPGSLEVLGPWQQAPDATHCWLRTTEGGDSTAVADRRVFVEKTPRVYDPTLGLQPDDSWAWVEGDKGEADNGDGPDLRSRAWADDMAEALGYVLPERRDVSPLRPDEQPLLDRYFADRVEVTAAVDTGKHALAAATVVADAMFAEATAVMGDVGWGERADAVRDAIVRGVATGPTHELTWTVGDVSVAKFTYHGPGDEWRVTTPGDGPHGAKFEIHPAGTVCRRATTAREVCLAVAATPLDAYVAGRVNWLHAPRPSLPLVSTPRT